MEGSSNIIRAFFTSGALGDVRLMPSDVAVVAADRSIHVVDPTVGVVVVMSDGVGTVAVATPTVVRERRRATNRTSDLIDRGLAGLTSLRHARAVIIGDRRDGLSRILAERVRSLLSARSVPVVAQHMDGAIRALSVDGFGRVVDTLAGDEFFLNAVHVPSRQRRADQLTELMKHD